MTTLPLEVSDLESTELECKEIKLSSWNWEYADTSFLERGSVESMVIGKEDSPTGICTYDEAYGFDYYTVWVNNGCRAEFKVCYDTMYSLDKKLQNIISTNNDELAKLKECTSVRIAFAYVMDQGFSGDKTMTIKAGEPVKFDKKLTDVGSSTGNVYDSSQGVFSCSVSGLYTFNVHALSGYNKNAAFDLFVEKDGNGKTKLTSLYARGSSRGAASMSAVVHLDKFDKVLIAANVDSIVFKDGGDKELNSLRDDNIFTGMLVQSDACLVQG